MIIFRVDGSAEIGIGHLWRCASLAKALYQRGKQCLFLSHCDELSIQKITSYADASYQKMPFVAPYTKQVWSHAAQQKDVSFLATIQTQDSSIECVVVDHYNLDTVWETAAKKMSPRLVVIDDKAIVDHHCDLLINQNFYDANTQENLYKNKIPIECLTLIGPQFSLLRDEFHHARPNEILSTQTIRNIVVSLGGSDPKDATSFVLDALDAIHFTGKVDVIIGDLNLHKEKLFQRCNNHPYFMLHVSPNNIARLLKNADFAIGAGGISTWERCCLGIPSLCIQISENQHHLKNLAQENYVIFIGKIGSITVETLANQINYYLQNTALLLPIQQNAYSLVDGLGAERVAAHLEALL